LINLSDDDLPPLYHAADRTSTAAQTLFLRFTRGRLLSLIGAAVFGLFTWKFGSSPVDWLGVAAALCFALALFVEAFLYRNKPERTWYEARAVAESVKDLSWKYAVGGEPFNIGTYPETAVADLFLGRLNGLFEVVKDIDLLAPTSSDAQISRKMRDVRALSLAERQATYEKGRIADQQDWYQAKATWNRGRANGWTLAMLNFEIAGFAGGIFKAIGFISGDLLTLSCVIVATITAWLQAKQHRTLATAYAVTALELASVRAKIVNLNGEGEWAKFVSDAEEAISREHTLWKASRGVRAL
jgi:SMODS and SLOG-associating 2TM effector domain 3/SMODS and SLOG-associating 2TM effector domain 1